MNVTTILPNYNHARFLNERMLSVLNQTYERNEIIILDDCSSDNSQVIIEGFNEEGKILKQGTYKKNIAIGEHNVFDSKGKLIHQTTYDKKGVKTYEMEVDEYGDQKVLYAASGPAKPAGIEEDDDPKNIEPVNEKKNKRKKRKERRKKE